MNIDFTSIHNHHEQAVCQAVMQQAEKFPVVAKSADLLADVACIALNRLPPRYIRHTVDYRFYLTDRERARNERALNDAVRHAFEFVQARKAMLARA